MMVERRIKVSKADTQVKDIRVGEIVFGRGMKTKVTGVSLDEKSHIVLQEEG